MAKTNNEIAKEVIQGKWGSGAERKTRLTKAGYDYKVIQGIVNNMLYGSEIKDPAKTEKIVKINLNETSKLTLIFEE